MALLTQWTWVWVNSRSWWSTGRPGMLQSMGLQSDRTEQLRWTAIMPLHQIYWFLSKVQVTLLPFMHQLVTRWHQSPLFEQVLMPPYFFLIFSNFSYIKKTKFIHTDKYSFVWVYEYWVKDSMNKPHSFYLFTEYSPNTFLFKVLSNHYIIFSFIQSFQATKVLKAKLCFSWKLETIANDCFLHS